MVDQNGRESFLARAYQTFLEHSEDMIFVKDKNLVYMAASDAFARVAGKSSAAELVGKTDFDIFSEKLAKKYTQDDRAILDDGICIENYIEPLPDQNGKKSYSSTSKYLIYDHDGQVIGIYGIARDVTAQIELETAYESSRFSRQMLFDSVLEADLTENKMFEVKGTEQVPGLAVTGESLFSEIIAEFADRFLHADYAQEFLACYDLVQLKEKFLQGKQEFSMIVSARLYGGEYRWIELRSRVYQSQVLGNLRIVIFLTDIDEETKQKQQLQNKASTDTLTGLYNRESVFEGIEQALFDQRQHKTACALLFIDLDYFKQVNDTYGHQMGDRVLREAAMRLKQLFREEDIVGRVGGDEFLAFLRQAPSKMKVEERAKKVVQALDFRLLEDSVDAKVTCSVGVAFSENKEGLNLKTLYKQADEAMYCAKQQGRNRFCFYDDIS